jgi:hypothetical protein
MTFRLPGLDKRITIVGRTGSGKTWKGAWYLSHAHFDKQPYVIVDYKGDDLLNSIDRVREIGLHEAPPKKPGLYIIKPHITQNDDMEAWLWKVHEQEKVGLYFDEAFMLPNSGYQRRGALQAILTQGRSKSIPVIALVQRPSQISIFVFSEADYYDVHHLNRQQDQKTMVDLVGGNSVLIAHDQEYWSKWYDVGKHQFRTLKPVPNGETIAETINERLAVKKRFF